MLSYILVCVGVFCWFSLCSCSLCWVFDDVHNATWMSSEKKRE